METYYGEIPAPPVFAEYAALRARIRALLRRIEWAGLKRGLGGDEDKVACPCCGQHHAPDCELAALLRECEA